MFLSPPETRLIEKKVFAVIMVFSLVSGLNAAFAPYLSYFLIRRGFTAVEIGFISVLLGSLQYIISPILFFVVLYMTCGGPLLNRIASVLMSLVFGSLVGYTIGRYIGSVVAAVFGQPSALFYPLSSLPQHVVSQTLLGFAVLAFSDIAARWRSALPIEELQKRRPRVLAFLVAFYVINALLVTVAVPVWAFYPSLTGPMPSAPFFAIALGFVFVLVPAGQLVVAAGLYYGKKWGWIIAVISSASSLLIDVSALVTGAIFFRDFADTLILTPAMLGPLVGSIVSLAVLLCLVDIEVRKFFGFVNPASQAQDTSTPAEPQ